MSLRVQRAAPPAARVNVTPRQLLSLGATEAQIQHSEGASGSFAAESAGEPGLTNGALARLARTVDPDDPLDYCFIHRLRYRGRYTGANRGRCELVVQSTEDRVPLRERYIVAGAFRMMKGRGGGNYDNWTIQAQRFSGQTGVGSNPELAIISRPATGSPHGGAFTVTIVTAKLNEAGDDQDIVTQVAIPAQEETWCYFAIDNICADKFSPVQGMQKVYIAWGKGPIDLVYEDYGPNRGQPDAPALADPSICPKIHVGMYKGGTDNSGGNISSGWSVDERAAGVVTTAPTVAEYYPAWDGNLYPEEITHTKGLLMYKYDPQRSIADIIDEVRGKKTTALALSATPDASWVFHDAMKAAVASFNAYSTTNSLPLFGSSAADTTETLPARGATIWVDPTMPDNTGAGTFESPKKSPNGTSNSLSAETEFRIKAGTTLPLQSLTAYTNGGTGTNMTLTAYDPETGAAVTGYKNPFDEFLATGRYPTLAEIKRKYFFLDGGRAPNFNVDGEGGQNISLSGGPTKSVVIRGAWFINGAGSMLRCFDGVTVRVEDVGFGDVWRRSDSSANVSHFSGNIIRGRFQGSIARFWIQASVNDVFWLGSMLPTDPFTITDGCAQCDYEHVAYGNEHMDTTQFTNGGFRSKTLQRVIFQHLKVPHYAKTDPTYLNGSDSSPWTESIYQGKSIIDTGGGSTTITDGTNPVIRDVMIVTNMEAAYFEKISGSQWDRVICVSVPNIQGEPSSAAVITVDRQGHTFNHVMFAQVGGITRTPIAARNNNGDAGNSLAAQTITHQQTLALA